MSDAAIVEENGLNKSGKEEDASASHTEGSTPTLLDKAKSSGDVSNLLKAMDGGMKRTEEQERMRQKFQTEKAKLVAELPAGTRRATDEERRPHHMIQDDSEVYVVPEGSYVTKQFFERCASMKIFAIPESGKSLMEVLTHQDRDAIRKHAMENNLVQRAAMTARAKSVSSVGTSAADTNSPPADTSNHPVTCLGTCCRDKTLKSTPVGSTGYRLPPLIVGDPDTVVDWTENDIHAEIKSVLTENSLVYSLNHWFYASLATAVFMILNRFALRLDQIIGSFMYYGAIALAFFLYYKFKIRKVVRGYRCPPHLLQRDLKQEVAIITGGTTGIGAEVVKQLYKQGISKIIIAERSYMIGLNELDIMKKEVDRDGYDVSDWSSVVELHKCNLEDLQSVYDFTNMIIHRKVPVHYLIMDHSTICFDVVPVGEFDSHFKANYLGHFLLAKQLFGSLRNVRGRAVTTTSQMYVLTKSLDLHHDFLVKEKQGRKGMIKMYLKSKAALILFTKMLSQRLEVASAQEGTEKAKAFVCSPGLCDDKLVNTMLSSLPCGRILQVILKPFLKTRYEGAQTAFKLLFEDVKELNGGGYYTEGNFYKTRGACNLNFPPVKHNIIKLWNMSNLIVHDQSFIAKPPGENRPTKNTISAELVQDK